jgi:nitrous oxidase accessory protein NosD
MSDIKVTEQEGWSGIAAALKRAQPGDRVLIWPGRYEGHETLNVPSGVTLSGCAEAELEFTGSAMAIRVENAKDVVVERLRLTVWRGMNDNNVFDYDQSAIYIFRSTQCSVKQCQADAGAKRAPLIAIVRSSDIEISDNEVSGGFWGICLSSSTGRVRDNFCHNSLQSGLILNRYPDSPQVPSHATIRGNSCYKNGQSGILFGAAISDAIEDNECWDNKFCGIALQRHELSPEEPSRAVIRHNRCYNNENSGILLSSSDSDAIEGNEAWNNKFCGIALQRHELSPDAPSQAVLRFNRCHDNEQTGILLSSSISDTIEGNECWQNKLSGILLQRNILSLIEQSEAIIRRNRCYDNDESGLSLNSSESSAVEGNECWNNKLYGISLQRDQRTLDAPSQALITNNNCHHNNRSGISLLSSHSDSIELNASWNNKLSGIALLPQDICPDALSQGIVHRNRLQNNAANAIEIVHSLGIANFNRFKGNAVNDTVVNKPPFQSNFPDPKLSDNIVDDTLDLPSLFLPELRDALAEAQLLSAKHKPLSAEGLAGFLISGSSGSFRTFWTGQYHAPEPFLTSDTPPETRHWRLVLPQDGRKLELSRLPVRQGDLTAMLINKFIKNSEGKPERSGGNVNWSAAVICDEHDADRIYETLNARVNGNSTDYVPEGGRISVPVRFDMTVGDATLRERLSSALMAGKSRSAERMKSLAKVAFAPILFMLIIATAIWFSPWSTLVTTWLSKLDIWVWLGGFASLLASLPFLDLFLPRHLRAGRASTADTIFDGIKKALGGAMEAVFETLTKLVPEARRIKLADRADLKWQRKQLFGNADIATLYLSDVTQWRDGDLAWLEILGASLTENQKLNVLIQLDGRLSLRPLLVEPEDCPWKAGIDLYLFDDVDKLRLRDLHSASDGGDDEDYGLLGAADEADIVRNELLNDLWCPTDLLPTLPTASAPTHRLRLQNKVLRDANQLSQGELVQQIFPAAQQLFTTGRPAWVLDSNSFWRPFEMAKRARALQTSPLRDRTGASETIAGRAGYRPKVAALLRGIWSRETDDQSNLMDWREYIVSSLRFGIWFAITEAEKTLQSPLSPETSLQVRRTLEAVRFLGEDMQTAFVQDCPLHGEAEVYQPAWDRLRNAMEALPDGPNAAAIIGAWRGAEELCLGKPPSSVEELLQRIEAMLTNPDAILDMTAETAIDAFCINSARQVIELRELDPRSRGNAIDRTKATAWRGFSETIIDRFNDWANGKGANSKSLAMLFAVAREVETVEKLIRVHRRNPIRTLYALANAATNHVIADHLAEGAAFSFDDRLPLIARTIAEFRDAWIKANGKGAVQLSREFAKGASGAAVSAQLVYDYFIAEGAAARIAELLTPDAASILQDLEGKFELELVV